jgi:hypothetical protein
MDSAAAQAPLRQDLDQSRGSEIRADREVPEYGEAGARAGIINRVGSD